MRYLENPIRIKITGKCNRKCLFCHEEGGMNIDDICFSNKFSESIEKLSKDFNMHSLAITGGEPLLYGNFENLIEELMCCCGIDKFSITTNGTVFKPIIFWKTLKEQGLYKVNISMTDLLNIKQQNETFDKYFEIIRMLNDLDIKVKLNFAIINDLNYTASIVEKVLLRNDFITDMVLLPIITNSQTFAKSQTIISNLCSVLNFECIGVRRRKGTSDVMLIFENNLKQRIYIKTTKYEGTPFYLHSICDTCKKRDCCQEGFYGIRLEQNQEELFIRLCIHKSTSDVVFQIDDFWNSDSYKEIQKLWI